MSHSSVNDRAEPLAAESRRAPVAREDVIALAHRWFLEGRRVDVQQLARELGIGRATVYRWWTSREVILGEVIWRMFLGAIGRVENGSRGTGSERFVAGFGALADTVRGYRPLAAFVADDPELALRVITSRQSVVQQRLIGWTAEQLAKIPELANRDDLCDLAYALVRLGETFLWSDMITGDPPRPDTATTMVGLMLAGAVAGDRGPDQNT